MRVHTFLILAAAAGGMPSAGAAEEPILAGYTGAYVGSETYKRFLPLLREHGFNTVDLKINPPDFDVESKEIEAFITGVVREAQAHGLRVFLYLYPEGKGQRDPATATSGPFVGDDGVMNARLYCLYQAEAWQSLFRRVFTLARLSRTLPIEAVKMDVELNENVSPCYCDDCWRSFAAAGGGATDLPAVRRKELLRWSGKEAAYLAHLEARLDRAAAAFAERAHRENPRLKLGMMPARDDLLTRSFVRGLGTQEAPAIFDNWLPYDGRGWRDDLARERDRLKALNPHTLFIPWMRINFYRPGDIPAHAFALATRTDGYNLWTLSMIHPENTPTAPLYALPLKHRDAMAYWRAFGQANEAARRWTADRAGYRPPFELKPIQALAPGIDPGSITVPDLKPLGPRDASRPAPPPSTYRQRACFTVYVADPAAPLRARIRHQAGKERDEPVSYMIVGRRGGPLVDALVQPGETVEVAQKVPEAGAYTLVVQGREGGGPWYDVSIPDQPYVVGGEQPVYFFRGVSRQYFRVPAGTASFKVRFATGGGTQQARLQVWNPRDERVLDETLVADKAATKTFEIPAGPEDQGRVWSLLVGRPEVLPAPYWSENYFVLLEGIPSYFSDRPDALLAPAPR